MKRFSFLLLFIVAVTFSSLSVGKAEQMQLVTLESISYNLDPDGRENIIFKLDGSMKGLNIFRLNGGNPRLVLDFPQTVYKGEKNIPPENCTLVRGIRTGAHTLPVMKTRVVIDLSNEIEVKYERVVSDNDAVLTIIFSPMYIENIEKKTDIAQISVGQGIGISKIETEETDPPVFSKKEVEVAKVAEPDNLDVGSQLLEVSFDNSSNKGEMVIFRLNDFYPPTVSAIEEETPRVLCDFMDMQLGPDVKKLIVAQGKYVRRIRTVRHENPDKIRVVLDLSSDRDYDLQQVFFKNDNLFVLIVNELPAEVVSD